MEGAGKISYLIEAAGSVVVYSPVDYIFRGYLNYIRS